jgi:glycosyltransferase involved in cell wall biosynthesis
VHVIENGIHVGHIQDVPSHTGSTDIVYVGRLVTIKHVDLILQATALIAKTKPQVRCLIVGNGPARIKLEKLAEELGIAKHVTFVDFRDNHDDVIAYMKSGKVFVLPSTREGFGLVVTEANAGGVPVITVDSPANAARKLINGKNGAVTKLDAADLAKGIERALDGRFKKADCIAAASEYDWQNIVHKFEKVLA